MFTFTDIKLSIEKEKNKNGVTFLELRRLFKDFLIILQCVYRKESMPSLPV